MKKVLRLVFLPLLVLVLAVLGGCGGYAYRTPNTGSASPGAAGKKVTEASRGDTDHDGIPDKEDALPGPQKPMGNMVAAPTTPPADAPPKSEPVATKPEATKGQDPAHEADRSFIIYTANVTMAVYQVEQGILAVEKIAKDNGGFLAQKGDQAITIRVPRARFEPALAAVDKIGDVIHRDVQAQDVTDEYVDLEIRIKNARAMRTRLQALLERANVKEALEIEKELHRVTEELERLEGKIKLLKDKIAYSTITVTFAPRGSALQASKIRLPFPWLQQLGLPNLLTLSEDK